VIVIGLIVVGAIVLLLGLIMIPLPGPGILVTGLGGVLLAIGIGKAAARRN
jgi:hypothetical protein